MRRRSAAQPRRLSTIERPKRTEPPRRRVVRPRRTEGRSRPHGSPPRRRRPAPRPPSPPSPPAPADSRKIAGVREGARQAAAPRSTREDPRGCGHPEDPQVGVGFGSPVEGSLRRGVPGESDGRLAPWAGLGRRLLPWSWSESSELGSLSPAVRSPVRRLRRPRPRRLSERCRPNRRSSRRRKRRL